MPLLPPKPTKEYEPVPKGNHVARLYQIIHIGTVPAEWQGEKKDRNLIRLTFELPLETKIFREGEGEKPFSISAEYTYSYSDKGKFLPIVEGIMGRTLTENEKYLEFDVFQLSEQPCMVNVVHDTKNDRTYSNISAVTPLPKGMKCPPQVNPSVTLSYENFDTKIFESLPKFLQDKMKTSKEFQAMMGWNQEPTASDDEVNIDDIPF